MGLIRFLVHPSEAPADWPEVFRGYMTGHDGRVYSSRIEVDGPVVSCRRPTNESGRFHVAWPVSGRGRPILGTSQLPEREEPYLLSLELARGKLVQVRNQLSAWELGGFQAPTELAGLMRAAQQQFAMAAMSQRVDPASAADGARLAVAQACHAADILAAEYVRQASQTRHQRYPNLPALLGCDLGQAKSNDLPAGVFNSAFNAAGVAIPWNRVEPKEGQYDWSLADEQIAWCERHKITVRGGPLVDLGPTGLPEWAGKWERDLDNLLSFVADYVETAVSRYQGRVRIWEIAARANSGGALTLNEEQRLRLVARVVESARRIDEESQLILRVDQPWGEYLARGQHRLSPLQTVDALARSNVGLSGVNLEIAIGYRPRGTPSRDLLEFSRIIDQWSTIGVPIHVTLAVPSSAEQDAFANPDWDVDPNVFGRVIGEREQAAWVEQFLPLIMVKPAVAGVFWSHCLDGGVHEFPSGGLIRRDNMEKPALQKIVALRGRFSR